MKTETLEPGKDKIEFKGSLYYSESFAAWNSLRLVKGIIQEFPQLKQKRAFFKYRMILYKNQLELERKFKQIKSGKEIMPVLMWFEKVKE